MSQALTQDELKTRVGQAALAFVPAGEVVGVGTGSTVNKFIDALATIKDRIRGAVSSSEASTARLRAAGITVFEAQEVDTLSVYIDGADEIDGHGYMIKGGGAALTREKIVAAQSRQFICIASALIIRQFAALGGTAQVRLKEGQPVVTDNGQHLVDVKGLHITDPLRFETEVSQWPGVVTVGVFAHQKAQVCLLGTASGVKTLNF